MRGINLVALTFQILLIARNDLLRILARQKEPLRCVAQIMIFHGQIFGKYGTQIGRRQTIGKGAEESWLCGMFVPIEAIASGKNIIIELHHGQH